VAEEASPTLPPQNIQAESSLLGSILLEADAITKIADTVGGDDFYEQRHGTIFRAMLELYEKRQPIDVLTLTDKLESSGVIDDVGGAGYITELSNSVPSAAHVHYYGDIVSKKATLRRLITAAGEITQLGYSGSDDTDELLDKAEQLLYNVSEHKTGKGFRAISDVLSESFDRIEELNKSDGKLRGVASGFSSLDNILAGFQNSDLLVLAARPAMGKSTFALNVAHHVAATDGVPVGIFSLEMSQEQLVDRMLSAESGVDSWKLRTGNLSDDDFAQIGIAYGSLSEAPIFIDDTPMLNVMEIRTKARRIQNEHGLGMIIIDYLQLMNSQGKYGDNRVQEVSEISRGLKGLARELNVPVVALSQLSRTVEQRNPQIPQLADLRESGSIEQDADVVLFLYREDYYNPETDREHLTDLFVKKHRNGPTGQVELYFHGEMQLFRQVDRKHGDEKNQG
jgi:replicative DNA helicase